MFFALGSGSTTTMTSRMGDYVAKDTGTYYRDEGGNHWKLCKWHWNGFSIVRDGAVYTTHHYRVGEYYGSYYVGKTGTNCTTY
jgi:hypothetical protein